MDKKTPKHYKIIFPAIFRQIYGDRAKEEGLTLKAWILKVLDRDLSYPSEMLKGLSKQVEALNDRLERLENFLERREARSSKLISLTD